MEQYKLGQLISNFEFVVGIMRIIENKTIESFVTALMDYQKIKATIVHKSSVRLKIDKSEYVINIKRNEPKNIVEEVFEETTETDMLEEKSDWEKQLSDNIIKKLIINHYLSQKAYVQQ